MGDPKEDGNDGVIRETLIKPDPLAARCQKFLE
jgi:hypothetical protein